MKSGSHSKKYQFSLNLMEISLGQRFFMCIKYAIKT